MKTLHSLLIAEAEKQKGTYDVLVLKGFSNAILQQMTATLPHLNGELLLDKKGLLDLAKIQLSHDSLLSKLAKVNSNKPQLLDMESFILIASSNDLDATGKRFVMIENNLLKEYPNQSNCTAEDFEDAIHAGKEIPDDSPFYKFYSNSTRYKELTLVQYIGGFDDEFESVRSIALFRPIEPELMTAFEAAENDDAGFRFEQHSGEYMDIKTGIYNGQHFDHLCASVEDSIRQQKTAFGELQLFAGALKALEISVGFYLYESRLSDAYRPEITALLKKHWNSDAFRMLSIYSHPDDSSELADVSQGAIIEEVIRQFENGKENRYMRDILLTAPTGSGKSLLFQLPAMYLAEKYGAVTIVISPLIALMKDQVAALRHMRNYTHVAYINSELSIIEREEILQKVHGGDISILYLSPELLLSQELSVFLGGRELGLLVIDEAHLVTTWGRDFRTDYWYLGNFIRKARRYFNYKFPVLAVTATAVYSGPNDMVFETLDSLYLENPRLFIGKVKREDIEFDIREMAIEKFHAKEKFMMTARRISEFIKAGKKTIVYCPWVSQLASVRDMVEYELKTRTGLYFGGLNKDTKNETYEHFKSNHIQTIISTKAFGMGVDIDDITTIYHHAPSGHLADYVQEIGRAARRSDITGQAMTDFNVQDLKFTRVLYKFSAVRQYQLQMVLDKILRIYNIKNTKNLLVSVNDFQYIFKEEDVDIEQKVKSSLILLEKDLQMKYHYNVLLARPKSLFTAVYARVNDADVKKFTSKYGKSARHIPQISIESKGQRVYSINLDKIWRTYFSSMNFPQVKKAYFDKALFRDDEIYVSPQIRIVYTLNQPAKQTFDLLIRHLGWVADALNDAGPDFFSESALAIKLEKKYSSIMIARRVAEAVLSVFSSQVDPKAKRYIFTKPECFIQQKKSDHDFLYKVVAMEYPNVMSCLKKRFDRMFGELPPTEHTEQFFIPAGDDKNVGMIQLAYVLEAFGLATYVIGGGEKPGVFIRINDPVKLERLAKRGYTNDVLKEIERRQKISLSIMEYFFTNKIETPQRWKFIEDYFLGTSAEALIGTENLHMGEEE